jgi:CHAT domain-containing protein
VCHGLCEAYDADSVFAGLFKLSCDERHPHGYLYAQEIAKNTLSADLAFMSACYSGIGKIQKEGNIGPVWAFLAAGALSTIAVHWPLPDSDLTIKMVVHFYEALLLKKLNKAQALREAVLFAIGHDREAPDKWGEFIYQD